MEETGIMTNARGMGTEEPATENGAEGYSKPCIICVKEGATSVARTVVQAMGFEGFGDRRRCDGAV